MLAKKKVQKSKNLEYVTTGQPDSTVWHYCCSKVEMPMCVHIGQQGLRLNWMHPHHTLFHPRRFAPVSMQIMAAFPDPKRLDCRSPSSMSA
jgi:hypothetical protein